MVILLLLLFFKLIEYFVSSTSIACNILLVDEMMRAGLTSLKNGPQME